jgi:hypothetical protein
MSIKSNPVEQSMSHPFEQFSSTLQKKLFVPLFILTVLIMVGMNLISLPLYTPEAPSGIISFELAFTPSHSQQIISTWSAVAQLRAAFIQGLDFLFALVYSFTLGLACLMAARVLKIRSKPGARLGEGLAWAMWLAATLDYIENIALVVLLFSRVRSPFPEIAGICGSIKFIIILVGFLYALYGFVIRLLPDHSSQPET